SFNSPFGNSLPAEKLPANLPQPLEPASTSCFLQSIASTPHKGSEQLFSDPLYLSNIWMSLAISFKHFFHYPNIQTLRKIVHVLNDNYPNDNYPMMSNILYLMS